MSDDEIRAAIERAMDAIGSAKYCTTDREGEHGPIIEALDALLRAVDGLAERVLE